ncbi:MAG: calcium-binding protein [Bacteroidota bacterium]
MTNQEMNDFIYDEIVVDCYDDWEVASAWNTVLSEELIFPFQAKAPIKQRGKAATLEQVEVVEFSDFGGSKAYVGVDWKGVIVKVDLLDLEDVEADEETLKYIAAWKFWNK